MNDSSEKIFIEMEEERGVSNKSNEGAEDNKTVTSEQNRSQASSEIFDLTQKWLPIDFKDDEYVIKCPYCHITGKTVLERKVGRLICYTSAALLLLLPPLFCIPFCIKGCYDKAHYCAVCNNKVGYYKSTFHH